MFKTIACAVTMTLLVATAASCSEEDPPPSVRAQRCEQLSRAACAVFVRCHVLVSGRVFSNEICEQALPKVAGDCTTKPENAAVGTATDAEIGACVSAYQGFPCNELCGRLAVDPPACQQFDTAPSQNVVQCAP